MDFIFLQVVLQVCRELQRLSESQVLHGWFSFPVNSRTIRKMQTLEILPQLIPMLARPGIEGVLRHPADSRDIAIWSFCRTICECEAACWAAFLRYWFDIHATYSQFMCSYSRKFFLHCWVALPPPFLSVCSITMSWRRSVSCCNSAC